jgi:hypothetical protein
VPSVTSTALLGSLVRYSQAGLFVDELLSSITPLRYTNWLAFCGKDLRSKMEVHRTAKPCLSCLSLLGITAS